LADVRYGVSKYKSKNFGGKN